MCVNTMVDENEIYVPIQYDERGVADFVRQKSPKFIEVGIQYGMITPGHTLDDYLLDAIFDPAGFECATAHNQQGAGKSNFIIQEAAVLAEARLRKKLKDTGFLRAPTEHEIWNAVLDSIVFTPADFVTMLEAIDQSETDRLDFVIWDDIQLEYTSSTFKTDIDQYAAIDSMFAVVRTKVACVFITIPNIGRLPKNVKDNLTIELYVGKNRRVQFRKLFRLPSNRRVESNLFKPVIQPNIQFDLFDIPAWAWKRYEGMRKDIADKALANLKGVTNMETMEGYVSLLDAVKIVKDNGLKWGIQSIQQMASRKIIKKQEINGELCIERESLMAAVESEKYTRIPLEAPKDTP